MIVTADDDLDDQALLESALRESKVEMEIIQVHDGVQLMDYLHGRNRYRNRPRLPDLIFLDLNMPLMDGFEVLRELLQYPMLAQIPKYVVTTSKSAHDRKAAVDLGANGFYSKGASTSEIKRIVSDVCQECFKA